MFNRRLILASASLAAAIALTACSGASTAKSSSLTGKPIVVMQVEGLAPGDPAAGTAGTLAAIRAVNNSGGIGGRPIQLLECEADSANLSQSCGHTAASNSKILAAVNDTDVYGQFDSLANAAGLAIVGGIPQTQQDFNAPNLFALQSGALSVAGSAALLNDTANAKNIALAYIDVPAGQTLTPTINVATLAPRGTKLAYSVGVPPTASDVSPYVAGIPSNTGGLVIADTLDQSAQLILAARNSGATYPICTETSTFSLTSMNKLVGSAGSNVLLASVFKLSGSGYAAYEAGMKATGQAGSSADDSDSVNGWLSIFLLKAAILKAGNPATITRQQILSTMPTISNYSTGGVTPVLNWTTKQAALGGALADIINPTVVAYKYNTKTHTFDQVGNGKFVNLLAAS